MTAPSIRARVRQELTEEIKKAARRQLASEGANLSLRAVARELGMVSSAVYRYYPSRDDLLTALIIDCYNELGEAAEQGEASAPREEPVERFVAMGQGVRDWALANPAEYALIYGSPVPGYAAPQDTVPPAARVTTLIIGLLVECSMRGKLADAEALPPGPLADELSGIVGALGIPLSTSVFNRGMAAWVQLFGLLSFELFGRLNGILESSRREFFDHQLRAMAEYVGITA